MVDRRRICAGPAPSGGWITTTIHGKKAVPFTHLLYLSGQTCRPAHLFEAGRIDRAIQFEILRDAPDLSLGNAICLGDLFGIFTAEESCGDLLSLTLGE